MAAKRHFNKKSTGQKKILSAVSKAQQVGEAVMSANKPDEAIVRQFHRIQRGYSILMNEVGKEYALIKNWIEKEASHRTEEWKNKITEKIPKF
jgi:hypothetical protein